MTDTATAAEADQPAAPADEPREALLAQLGDLLGDKLVDHSLVAGRDLWIRVDRRHWQDAGMALRRAGLSYFGFLSAIDWMDAPDGRYEVTELDSDDDPPPSAEAADDADADADAEAADGAEVEDAPADVAADPDAEAEAAPRPEAATRRVGGVTRFQVFARVQKPGTALGVTVKADVPENDLSVDTWVEIYAGANWHEREAWEMFGIEFIGHPDLRKLYLPGEFEGHPLRKDYPLLARVVKPWPGVVDIEEIPAELEEQLEAEVMAAFEAEQAAGEGGEA